MDRPWFRDSLAADTADAQLRALVHGGRQILDRIAPVSEVLRTAATIEPEIAELWQQDTDPRFTVYATAAKAFVTKPGVRKEISAEHAADVLFALLRPERYLLLVRDRSWTPVQWEHWAYDTLRSQLLDNNLSAP